MAPIEAEFRRRLAQQEPKLIIAVPARIGSTRLKNKPLAQLGGQPLIVRVAQRVLKCLTEVRTALDLSDSEIVAFVATDSTEIQRSLEKSGIPVVMTPAELPSGTDRIEAAVRQLFPAEQVKLSPDTLIVNLQGDEPFFCIEDILRLIQTMEQNPSCPMGTLAYKNSSAQQFATPSCVKVIRNDAGEALYFSRSPIPWPRAVWGASEPAPKNPDWPPEKTDFTFLQHIGIYAFRLAALEKFTKLKPSRLELIEGLEQLRALEAGWDIQVVDAQEAPFGIDTEADLARASQHLKDLEVNE